jgi:TetR/AcrR family transcriptional regulator
MGASGTVPDQILDVATRRFASHGFEGTSLQDISAAVGVRKQTLLYHFDSKEELRSRVFARMLEHWQLAVPRLLKAAASGEGRFTALITEVLNFFVESPDRARLVMRELLDRPKEFGALLSAYVQPWISLIADEIRRGQDVGNVRKDVAAEHYAFHILTLILSFAASIDLVPASVAPKLKAKTALERHRAELIRIAHHSLFAKP